MRDIFGKLRKLKGRSFGEFRERGAQSLAVMRERRGWSASARLPNDTEFLQHRLRTGRSFDGTPSADGLLRAFRERAQTTFFPSLRDREGTVAELRARWAGLEQQVIAEADKICAGRFDVLGYTGLRFGDPVDWHLDPVAGLRAPLLHWSRVPYLDAAAAGDHKVIWEINRHQHFLTLGRAYWLTGDERYARAFAEHLASWMDANPPKLGINWASSLELAFRSISWIWALHFFRDSPHLTPGLFLRTLKFLEMQGRHVERFLSTYFSPNTHLTGEALGLWYLGTVFPELRLAQRWRERGHGILLDQLGLQVHSDGVYFEQASYYQRYTVDFYLHLWALTRANGGDVEHKVRDALSRLLDHLLYLARPDGTTPLYGDDDGGRLVKLDDREPNDFRAALATGAILLGRSDLRFGAGAAAEETLWLLGAEAMRAWDNLPAAVPSETSRGFPEGGYYIMRDGWHRDANYLLIDCGPHGTSNCGHAHADALALEVAAAGQTALVDSGTYTYTAEPELREQFRLSQSHNTVTVDGESSAVPEGPFSWQSKAVSRPLAWATRERFDFFEGEHDGYARLASPATHRRAVFFLRGEYWVVRDRILSEGEHELEAKFHLAPGAEPGRTPSGNAAAGSLRIQVFGADTPLQRENAWISPVYGSRIRSAAYSVRRQGSGEQEIVTLLWPRVGEEPQVREEASARGGRVLRITTALHDDMVVTGDGALVMEGVIETDAEFVWIRRSVTNQTLQECVLLCGRRVCAGGKELFRSATPAGYVHLCWNHDAGTLHADTDATGEAEVAMLGLREVIAGGDSFFPGGRDRCILPPRRVPGSFLPGNEATLARGE